MKHITIVKFEVPTFNKGLIKVTAQTNLGTAFGNSADGKTFTASNGITLGSNLRPARDADNSNTIWLRGTDTTKSDDAIGIPVKRLKKVIDAIKEYNVYYSVEQINARVRAKRAADEAEARRAQARAYRAPIAAPVNPCTVIIG